MCDTQFVVQQVHFLNSLAQYAIPELGSALCFVVPFRHDKKTFGFCFSVPDECPCQRRVGKGEQQRAERFKEKEHDSTGSHVIHVKREAALISFLSPTGCGTQLGTGH